MPQRSIAAADTGVGNAMRAATLGHSRAILDRSSGAGRPSVERPWFTCLRPGAVRFRASPAQPGPRCSGVPGTARRPLGRTGVTRIALAPSRRLAQDGVQRGIQRLHRDRDAAQSPSWSRTCCICPASASALGRTRRCPLARCLTEAVAGLAVRRTDARLDGAFACRLAREGGVSASAPSGFPGGRPRLALKLGPAALPGGRPRRAPARLLVSREAGSGGLRAMVQG